MSLESFGVRTQSETQQSESRYMPKGRPCWMMRRRGNLTVTGSLGLGYPIAKDQQHVLGAISERLT